MALHYSLCGSQSGESVHLVLIKMRPWNQAVTAQFPRRAPKTMKISSLCQTSVTKAPAPSTLNRFRLMTDLACLYFNIHKIVSWA